MKTRAVSKPLSRNYLRKAEEYSNAMNNEFSNQRWNSCVLNAIHCGISAADALTIFFKGVRHAGERHEEVINLLQTLDLDKNILGNKTKQLLGLLDVKNSAEYEEKLTNESGALTAVKNAERFFSWVKEVLKE
ncbi:MAG: HEPN domain-containing protein [Candidatus Woesearchaeota archaeon]|nr:HEPN domain-containing protein [Candidatus Woesearchaeota archaeon]